MRHRFAAFLLALALLLGGCAPIAPEDAADKRVYASFYPIYAISGLVLGDVPGIRLSCLVQPQDGCLRAYTLSDWDLSMLAYGADAVIIGGRGLEAFGDMLYSLGAAGPAVLLSMDGLELYNQGDETLATEDSSHLMGENPHLFMSVSGAKKIAANVADGMAALYPTLSAEILAGEARAQEKLSSLYEKTQAICAGIRGEKVILMNEALIYPALEYGLDVAYWSDRESGAALDVSPALLGALAETGAQVILIEKQAPAELAAALAAAGYAVGKIDILSSYALDAGFEGYIAAQIENARTIARAYGLEGN